MVYKHVILINGRAKTGKDTFVEGCSKFAKVKNVSAIDRIRDIAKLCGYEGKSKTIEDRLFLNRLQEITTDYSNLSANDVISKYKDFLKTDEVIMFIHARRIKEITYLKENIPLLKTLLIYCKNRVDPIEGVPAEDEVDKQIYDTVVLNDSTIDTFQVAIQDYLSQLPYNTEGDSIIDAFNMNLGKVLVADPNNAILHDKNCDLTQNADADF